MSTVGWKNFRGDKKEGIENLRNSMFIRTKSFELAVNTR